jgi:hypothetical protein
MQCRCCSRFYSSDYWPTIWAPRSGYSITVNPTPNPEYAGFAPEQIASANRAKFEAV